MSFDEVSAGAVVFYRGDALEYLLLHYPSATGTSPRAT